MLLSPRVSCEMICYYVHLHPAIYDMIYRMKGTERIRMIRYYGKDLAEYVPASIRRSSKYAYACLSDAGDYFVPVNDAHPEACYSPEVLNFLARMNAGDSWKRKSNIVLEYPEKITGDIINYLIFGQRCAVKETVKSVACENNTEPASAQNGES